jgi:hypothetical protein
MADTASYSVTTLLVSLVPILDFLTTEGSIQGTSEISSRGASWRVFITSAFAMGSIIGSLITAFNTQAFTLGLINHSGF